MADDGTPPRPEAPTAVGGPGARGVGLPDRIRACLFDLDGVLTRTAEVHAAAWKEMFDGFLERRARDEGTPFRPFDVPSDYDAFVDGRPRADGVRTFLGSRGISLPDGRPDDPPGSATVAGLGSLKNRLFLERLHVAGVRAYEGSVAYLDAVRARGLRVAVVSSSANCGEVLKAAGIAGRFDATIDGNVARRLALPGKPAPDTYLAAARELGVPAAEAAVFEDALAGVASGRAGHFGFVVGVDRVGQADALRAHGADRVVDDLAELLDRP